MIGGAVTPTQGEAAARLGVLARAGEILASLHEGSLARLADLLCTSVASCCAIDVLEDDGTLARAGGRCPLGPDAPHGPAVVMRTGEPELVTRPDERLGLRSYLCVPLLTGDRALGAITLGSADRVYGTDDLALARDVARRAAGALHTARLLRSLERSEARYRLLFEQSPLPMWVYDAVSLQFLAVNDAAVRHYGYSREEFLGMRITDIRPVEDVEALLADLQARGGPGSPMPGTWRHQRKDASIIDVEITAGTVEFEGRTAALVLAHDVTERTRLQERLREAEKLEAIGRLAGGVAHDFNNLLTVISGYASLLQARGDDCEELAEIAHAAEQAAALTGQLLAFSRRQVLRPAVLDLNEIVAGMEPMVQRLIGEDVSVAVRLAPALARVEADRAQLERVMLNLAANARDAMPAGGRLTIETANVELGEDYVRRRGEGTPGPNVLLAVSDTGIGMSEDVQRHVFEPFFTTKEAGGGTGLGLATVFGVVKQSGGSIYVYSEEGRGTTFKIHLPAVAGADDAPGPAAPAEPATERGSETVMVVEDDESVRDLVRLMLENRGYTVMTAAGAAEAEELSQQSSSGIHLLLTDVVMPGVNGRTLAERLSTVSPGMRVLFMSGYSDEAVYRHGEIRPDAAFIEKPFTERALARKVRAVLDAA